MIQESISAIQGIGTVLKMAKALKKISDDVNFNTQVAEIVEILASSQNDLLVAQANYSDLLKVKDEIEKELTEYKNWDKEKPNYQLTEISRNVFVYCYKSIDQSTEPVHWLCANCYTDNKKSILQRWGRFHSEHGSSNIYICRKCELQVIVENSNIR